MPTILRSAHAEYRVTDLEAARHFYVETLGFLVTRETQDALFLGGMEERDLFSFVLRKAESPGLSHVAFRVEKETDLDALQQIAAEDELPTVWVNPDGEPGQGRALRIQDPNGIPIEFFHKHTRRDWQIQHFHKYRGASVMRLDHFNCQVTDVQKGYDWYTKRLNFHCSEYTATDDQPEKIWAAWLHRKQNVHDIALMNGVGPRLHHIGFWVYDRTSILTACDVLASMGYASSIERGPGRHGISNAFFLYVRDPDGNRIELFTSDYLLSDWDMPPVRWSLSDPRRATFWGHIPPKSWFDEASFVEDIRTHELLPVSSPPLKDRPEFVT
ncbi:MAG TPA: 3,4-dihydroxyphenylacetate 2,3-dioxygenase [bacterium]|jgi:3,4-dihydroxyphenylacetate 2,3-dioxygenase